MHINSMHACILFSILNTPYKDSKFQYKQLKGELINPNPMGKHFFRPGIPLDGMLLSTKCPCPYLTALATACAWTWQTLIQTLRTQLAGV